MEIDEFLTRISVSDATPTIFRISERTELDEFSRESKGTLKGIWSHTNTTDRAITVSGFIIYDKPFPEQIFAIPSGDLRNVLAETERVEIRGSYLLGYGEMDFQFKLEIMNAGKGLHLTYDNPDVFLTKEMIKKIIKIDRYIDSVNAFVDADGKSLSIRLENRNGNSGKVTMESDFPEFHARFEKRFVECLKLVGDNDATLNLDGYDSKREHKAHGLGRIQVRDTNAIITYYMNEITQKVQEQKKSKKSKDAEPGNNDDVQAKIDEIPEA